MDKSTSTTKYNMIPPVCAELGDVGAFSRMRRTMPTTMTISKTTTATTTMTTKLVVLNPRSPPCTRGADPTVT